MKTVLTIAGSDPSGGAGIQADIKTITVHGLYAMSAVTALTVQNTLGVSAVEAVSSSLVAQQIDCVFEDIRPDAVKIGMLGSAAVIQAVAQRLRFYHTENIVLDPVMVSTSGHRLLDEQAIELLKQELFPLARVITPNLPEAEALCGFSVQNEMEMERAARFLSEQSGVAVLLKGGHLTGRADDLLYEGREAHWLSGERVSNPNTHGTGCTLSSAIACHLAQGEDLLKSVRQAKSYLTGTLKAGLNLGKGNGPLNHMYQSGTTG
ncbi:MAG: bifunctional hydroxymethylpyrimidine kinase/phosphomethylpyrimidine kinase [Clostridiales bacterium]|nr:bifunctional hydroxymethylpyrimidine kinase/phosphomethylpyrimidine kinase [Clostridiales bacterium]